MLTTQFLGIDFASLNLDHQNDLEPFLKRYPQRLSGYTFAVLISWNPVYHYAWNFIEQDTLLISFCESIDGQRHLLQPVGAFSLQAQQALLEALGKLDYPCSMVGVSEQFLKQNGSFCSHFFDCDDRKMANYVYKTQDLVELAGRRYDKKRNLIAQAEHLYTWSVHPLTEKCKPHCPRILADIGLKGKMEISAELSKELEALETIMSHFLQLRQQGCLIRIDGSPVAFSIYEELNPSTAVVHFEKAERQYKGLYQIINRETAKAIHKGGYAFINREEDLGIEGLHKAKSSYFPVEMVASHTLEFKGLG